MNRLFIVGIGYKPLEIKASKAVLDSGEIITSGRLLEVFMRYDEYEAVRDRTRVINSVDETIKYIKDRLDRDLPSDIVLLASGDPLFFGIGRRAIAEFGSENLVVLPDLSSLQVAFSRIGETWDDALLMSLHGGPDPSKRRRLRYELQDIPSLLEKNDKIAVLTDRGNNPAAIAAFLHKSYSWPLNLYVCERLGYADEKITRGGPQEISLMSFAEPNVVILKIPGAQKPGDNEQTPFPAHALPPVFGLTEEQIVHTQGLITKDEIRAVTIHKLRLPRRGTFWDIGSGSGSIAIEAARLAVGTKVFAIEQNPERLKNIRENADNFNVFNMKIIDGTAPEALYGLPSPDRVFIGGSGGRLKEIIGHISEKMSAGIVVINASTIETLNEALQALGSHRFSVSTSEISVSRSKIIGGKTHLSALNPVFIITGERTAREG